MRKALIKNGIVDNIIVVDPDNLPNLEGELVDADGAQIGGTWNGVVFGPIPIDIEKLRSEKIAELSTACGRFITSGFTSNALGAPYTYDSDLESQLNLAGAAELNTTIPYTCADADGVKTARSHSAAQIHQVLMDGATIKINALAKFRTLKDEALAATTADQIISLKW